MTHRQHLTWTAYLEDQWNQPNRSDFYSMQVAWAVQSLPAQIFGGKGSLPKVSDFKLNFGGATSNEEQREHSEKYGAEVPVGWTDEDEEAFQKLRSSMTKSRWMTGLKKAAKEKGKKLVINEITLEEAAAMGNPCAQDKLEKKNSRVL